MYKFSKNSWGHIKYLRLTTNVFEPNLSCLIFGSSKLNVCEAQGNHRSCLGSTSFQYLSSQFLAHRRKSLYSFCPMAYIPAIVNFLCNHKIPHNNQQLVYQKWAAHTEALQAK